ncbi:MAG TPA: hypothetical protein VI756_25780 [Blastocatellia bacterium]
MSALSGTSDIFHAGQVQRFMDSAFSPAFLAINTNPILARLPQFIGFGSGAGCTPQHAGEALRDSLRHINSYDLLEHAAQARKWIDEHTIVYVQGKLPYWLRAPLFVIDLIKLLIWVAQLIATVMFLINLIRQEIEEAMFMINQANALVNFVLQSLSPAGLRTAAEKDIAILSQQAIRDLAAQAGMHGQTLACLF